MYIVVYFMPQFDGNPDFKIKFFDDLSSAECFAARLEEHGFLQIHGIYHAAKMRYPHMDCVSPIEAVNHKSISTLLVENYIHGFGVIQRHQLDDALYDEWSKIMTALYKCGRQLRQSEDWSSHSELRTLQGHTEIYELAKQAFDMIGYVNGYPLRRSSDLGMLIVTYASNHFDKDEKKCVCVKGRSVFRLRFENYLAREIIEQQSKTQEMLVDDYADIKLVRKFKTSRHEMLERKARNRENDLSNCNVFPSINVEFTSFVVRCYSFKCNKNHNIEQIRAIIEVMMPAGTIIGEEVAAGYCRECNLYFIFEADYARLRERGILLCQMISQKTYEQDGHESFIGSNLKPESILHQSGYNVSSSEDLTDLQRQEILRRVIDSGLYSKTALIGFLDWLISRNEKVSKKDMSGALYKWHMDREYVANYSLKAKRGVKVEKLIE